MEIISSIIPPIVLLLIGGLCRRGGWLGVEADASLSILTIRILYPCFFFFHIIGNKYPILPEQFLTVVFVGFTSICVGFGCALIVAKFMKIDIDSIQSFTFCSGIFNYGFFAFPIAASIFGNQLIAKIILFNLGVEMAIWTVGVWVLASTQFKFSRLLNPPIISIILALIVQKMGGQSQIPYFIWEIISSLGNCAIPVGLILIGGNFADLVKDFELSQGNRIEISSILVRLLIVPLLMFCYACKGPIPDSMDWLRDILIIQSAMPSGIFAIVIVKSYSGDTKTAMRAILASTICCFVTMPIWLYLGINYAR